MISFIARLGISAATYRAWNAGVWWGRVLLPLINFMFRDDAHCERAHAKEQSR
jgi:hypothetical protein